MYMQLLAEAVAELRGRPIEQPKELKLEVPVDAHLPTAAAELADRDGPPPPPVRNLLDRPERRRAAS
jgi:hypothetical protein